MVHHVASDENFGENLWARVVRRMFAKTFLLKQGIIEERSMIAYDTYFVTRSFYA